MSMEHWWNDTDRGKTGVLRQNLASVPLCTPQIPFGIVWDTNRTYALRDQRKPPEPWHGGTGTDSSLLRHDAVSTGKVSDVSE